MFDAIDGKEGWRLLALQTEPVVLLLNYLMPNMDGYDVLLLLEKHPALLNRTRTIFFTDLSCRPSGLDNLLWRLAIPVIDQPFDGDVMLALVHEVSGRGGASCRV